MLNTIEELTRELNRWPRLEEIAEKMGLPREDIVWLLELQNPVVPIADFSASGEKDFFVDRILNEILLKEKLNALPPRERQVIVFRYLLDKSQEEVAKILGLSQSHISRLERQALKYLMEE